jgi:hypothetical protein
VQTKLHVSTPGDALEQEADLAADQMLSGGSARVGSGAGIQRETTDDMDREAAAEARTARSTLDAHPMAVSEVHLEGSGSQAQALATEIQGYEHQMSEGASDGTEGCVTAAQVDANHNAVETLQTYANRTGDQSTTLGQFQAYAERLFVDYARIQGQVAGFNDSGQGGGAVSDGASGRGVADAVITGASGGTFEELQRVFREETSGANPAVSTHSGLVSQTRTLLRAASAEIPRLQITATASESTMRAAHSALVNAVTSVQVTGLESQIAALRASAEAAKQGIEVAADVVKGLIRTGTAVAEGGHGAGEAVVEDVGAAFSIVEYLANHHYEEDIARVEAQIAPLQAQRDMAQVAAARETAHAATLTWQRDAQAYVDAIQHQQQLQRDLDRYLRDLGAAADRGAGGNSFSIAAQVLSACETFLSDADTALGIGHNEEARAAEASAAAAGANPPRAEGRRQPLLWYRPYQFWHVGGTHWGATEMTAYLSDDARTSGNRTVRETLEQLTRSRTDVEACASRLRGVLGGG